jgi:hypothetical protein
MVGIATLLARSISKERRRVTIEPPKLCAHRQSGAFRADYKKEYSRISGAFQK